MNETQRVEEIKKRVHQAYWAQQYGQNESRPDPLVGHYYKDVSWLIERYEALDSALDALVEEVKRWGASLSYTGE